MKLLVISHACITAVNQAFYADVARIAGWQVDLVVPERWDTEYAKGVETCRWKTFHGEIFTIPVWKSGNVPLHIYKTTMVALLRKAKPDMIYVHHEPYGLATAQVYLANLLTGNVPVGFYAAQNILKNYPIPFRWFEQMVFRLSSFSFPVTKGALRVLRSKGYTGPAEVLPLSLDREVYFPRPEWAANKRKELGLAPDTFIFGYLGRLVEEKGLVNLLTAVNSLKDKRWHCIFVGSGPLEGEMRRLVAKLGLEDRVHFNGFVPHSESPGWLTLFDALMLPSESRPNWKEQFGRVIVEANACGSTVIGTDSGEIAELIESTSGIVVPEADSTALAVAMRRLLQNPGLAKQLANEGSVRVRQRYDQEVLAGRFIEALEAAHAARSAG
jgi:glycosyltransferase involved in cell wall biosynthesis